METQQIYYLFSQDNENLHSELTFIDPSHMDNFFEVIKIDNNSYKITEIHKNKGLPGIFKIGDTIYFNGGMISFHTKNIYGKIDQIECYPTIIIEKNKITLFDEIIDTKINELIDLISEFENKNQKYIDIKNALSKI